jgi:hypothetical protein
MSLVAELHLRPRRMGRVGYEGQRKESGHQMWKGVRAYLRTYMCPMKLVISGVFQEH